MISRATNFRFAFGLILASSTLLAQTADTVPQKKEAKSGQHSAVHQDPAEHAFQTHCSRCHNAPETLSPNITGTVVRHMRMRADLSAEEERLILSFFNP